MKTRRKKHTAQEVCAAISESCGIKATIARRLHVHRDTVQRYLSQYPEALQAYTNEVESTGDMVEEVILDAIRSKDVETAKWYARTKLRDRGYSERLEHTGADGGELRLFLVEAPPVEESKESWIKRYREDLASLH